MLVAFKRLNQYPYLFAFHPPYEILNTEMAIKQLKVANNTDENVITDKQRFCLSNSSPYLMGTNRPSVSSILYLYHGQGLFFCENKTVRIHKICTFFVFLRMELQLYGFMLN